MTTSQTTRLLKANDVRGLGSNIVFNFEDLKKRCEDHVDQTRARARQLLIDAQQEAAEMHARVLAAARAEGLQIGMAEANETIERRAAEVADCVASKKLDSILPAMQEASNQMVAERDRWLARSEAVAIRLSGAIANRLVGRTIEINPEIGTAMIAQALQLAAGTPHLTLRLNPRDIELLGGLADDVVRSMATCGEAELIADEDIECGGCLIETQTGQIDARLETMLDRICDELIE
ncbi:MAG: hypothetical protein CMJ48_04545 [Planctomycetaceae bacterium]|nr:hypothetical protein [Planctomycetaceae bacterium]